MRRLLKWLRLIAALSIALMVLSSIMAQQSAAQVPEAEVPDLCLELDEITVDMGTSSPEWSLPGEDTPLVTTAQGDSARVWTVDPPRTWICKLQDGSVYLRAGPFGVYQVDSATLAILDMIETESRVSPFHVAAFDHPIRSYYLPIAETTAWIE